MGTGRFGLELGSGTIFKGNVDSGSIKRKTVEGILAAVYEGHVSRSADCLDGERGERVGHRACGR